MPINTIWRGCINLILAIWLLSVSFDSYSKSVSPQVKWITLGTMGGPIASSERNQPSNALIVGEETYLIDCGDGTAGQLAKVGIPLNEVKAILLSHLHFDHVGGLAAILGMRFQLGLSSELEIYGPKGTKGFVDGLIASMKPAADARNGIPFAPYRTPSSFIKIVELVDEDTFAMGNSRVTVIENTHFAFPNVEPHTQNFGSLSFRFDTPTKSIAFTGDTGPSKNVEKLFNGTDILISEIVDIELSISQFKSKFPQMEERQADNFAKLLKEHHLTPENVGLLAKNSHAGLVVLTHFVAPNASSTDYFRFKEIIARSFSGNVALANDLDTF